MASQGYGASSFSQHSQPPNFATFDNNPQTLASLVSSGMRHNLVGGDDTATPFVALRRQPPSPCLGQSDIPGGGHGGGGGRTSNKGSGNNSANKNKKLKQPTKGRGGRPIGAKNKPKPPVLITKMDDEALKHIVIEISPGCDIVEELIRFAEIHDVGITVLSGSGAVTDVTLSHTFPDAPSSLMTLHGTFTMLSLSGTYVKTPFSSSSSSSSPLPTNPPPPSSFPVAVPSSSPGYSCFTICLAGVQSQIFGGVIGGRILAANHVVIVTAVYKKPMFHRILNDYETNSLVVDLSDVIVDHDDAEHKDGANNNAGFMALLSSFHTGVSGNSSSPMDKAP